MTSRLPLAAAALVLALLPACSDDEPAADTSGTISSETVSTPETTDGSEGTTTETAPPPTSGEVTLTEVAQVNSLSALAAHPDTRERFGQRARDLVSAKHAVDELAPQIVEAIERTRRAGRSTP